MTGTPASTAPGDPTTPGPTSRPTALGAALTSGAVGTPLSIVTIWLLETYGSAHGQPLKFDEYQAAAVGAVGAAVLGYATHILTGLVAILQERLTRP